MNQLFLASLLLITTCSSLVAQLNTVSNSKTAGSSFPSGEQFKGANITYTIISAANNTWSYDILMEGRLFIHQPSAPGLPGNEGFKTKEAAGKVAELVIGKMRNGEMPPSITLEEIKK